MCHVMGRVYWVRLIYYSLTFFSKEAIASRSPCSALAVERKKEKKEGENGRRKRHLKLNKRKKKQRVRERKREREREIEKERERQIETGAMEVAKNKERQEWREKGKM